MACKKKIEQILWGKNLALAVFFRIHASSVCVAHWVIQITCCEHFLQISFAKGSANPCLWSLVANFIDALTSISYLEVKRFRV